MPGSGNVPAPRYVNTAMLRNAHQALRFDVDELARMPLLQRAIAAEKIIQAQVGFNALVVTLLENIERTLLA